MKDLTNEILELIRLTSTNLPDGMEKALQSALEDEQAGSAARGAMETILKNIAMTRKNSTPICQDTGTPIFFVRVPEGGKPGLVRAQIRAAVAEATKQTFLRPNAVHALTGANSGNNLGDDLFPTIHIEEAQDSNLVIDLLLKGGGCENVSTQYSLPDDRLQAGRDLEGVRKVVLDAVHRAQGEGCAPGFLGVAIGGDRGTGYVASKKALLRDLDEANPDPALDELEKRITNEANELGIGPMGFGGRSTVLATRITATHRLPASFFVTIAYMCWAYRHRRMTVAGGQITYK